VARRYAARRVKIHRNYSIAEVAALLRAHKHTVRRWIADGGLPTTDARRPLLVHGEDLRAFLRARQPAKQPCRTGEFYCLPCRAPKRPALDMADYIPRTATRGMLRGLCPTCERFIYRAASLRRIEQERGSLDVAFPNAEQPLVDSSAALSNVGFKKDERT
jgi:excisionase family DNA binding protein